MIRPFDNRQLDELLAVRGAPCLSLFLPTHRHGRETLGDRTAFRQLLREVERTLAGPGGVVDPETTELMAPAWRLLDDALAWQHLGDGLAVFLAPGFHRVVRVGIPLPSRWEIDERPIVAPLLPALAAEPHGYVLALSVNAVRLLEVGPESVERLAPAGLPADMATTLGIDHYYSELQRHSGGGPRAMGRRASIVHGHGDHDEEHVEHDFEAYFRRVAEPVLRLLAERPAPLVVATVEEHLPFFRRALGDPALVAEVILGSPDALSDAELAAMARSRLAAAAEERNGLAVHELRELAGRRRVEAEAEEVVAAAEGGRVDTLFFDPSPCWGSTDPLTGKVRLHPSRQVGDVDVVNRAVIGTLERRGRAIAVPPAALPSDGPLAAILRY